MTAGTGKRFHMRLQGYQKPEGIWEENNRPLSMAARTVEGRDPLLAVACVCERATHAIRAGSGMLGSCAIEIKREPSEDVA